MLTERIHFIFLLSFVMDCPRMLQFAFFFGLNPYSYKSHKNVFYTLGSFILIYIFVIWAYLFYLMVRVKYTSAIIIAVTFRGTTAFIFVLIGISDFNSTVSFYGDILNEIEPSKKKRIFSILDFAILVLLGKISPEFLALLGRNLTPFAFMVFVSAFLSNVVPLLTMAQFALCSTSLSTSYRGLQQDILHIWPRTAAFTLRRLRLAHLDVVDRGRLITRQLSGRLLLYVLLVQLILLEKADKLIDLAVSIGFNTEALITLVTFLGYLGNLWYFIHCSWNVAKEQEKVIVSLLSLPTIDMDAKAMNEMTLLAGEIHDRPPKFSAAGCFYLEYNILYSVIGIIFSYVMIVGPLAFKNLAESQL